MARIVVLGGGFGGVITAESLARKLDGAHHLTLLSRSRSFVFYPALVRRAFGMCTTAEIVFDINEAMHDRGIHFVQGEVARVRLGERTIEVAGGDFIGTMPYDFLVIATGRRLKTELISGFYEHANHLLSIRGATKFGDAVNSFHKGKAVFGHCNGARLPVPLLESAFALSNELESCNERGSCQLTVVGNTSLNEMFAGAPVAESVMAMLQKHQIQFIEDFSIVRVTSNSVIASDGRTLECDLNLIIPPFGGPGPLVGADIVDQEGYILIEPTMRVRGIEGAYAVGDCVNLPGPKLAHMAVCQAEIAAENLVAEINGKPLTSVYNHEMMLVIDGTGVDSIFIRKDLDSEEPADIQMGRFWGWAKRKQQRYWEARHV